MQESILQMDCKVYTSSYAVPPHQNGPIFKTALEICTSAISLTAHQTHKHDLGDGW